jgi:hypothetical protein
MASRWVADYDPPQEWTLDKAFSSACRIIIYHRCEKKVAIFKSAVNFAEQTKCHRCGKRIPKRYRKKATILNNLQSLKYGALKDGR